MTFPRRSHHLFTKAMFQSDQTRWCGVCGGGSRCGCTLSNRWMLPPPLVSASINSWIHLKKQGGASLPHPLPHPSLGPSASASLLLPDSPPLPGQTEADPDVGSFFLPPVWMSRTPSPSSSSSSSSPPTTTTITPPPTTSPSPTHPHTHTHTDTHTHSHTHQSLTGSALCYRSPVCVCVEKEEQEGGSLLFSSFF